MSPLANLFIAIAVGTLALPAAAAAGRGTCEWKKPAADAYMGDVPSAVDRYTDIPAATRSKLKARMQRQAYDDIVSIRRDSIEGNFRYEPALLDMHFGKGSVCGEVTRKTWQPDHQERALAYCEDGQCIVVPMVCRNVSRIVRKPGAVAMGGPAGPSAEPLAFEPPGAGLPAAGPAATAVDAGPDAHPMLAAPQGVSPLPAGNAPNASTSIPPLPPAVEGPVDAGPPLPLPPQLPNENPPVVVVPPDAPGGPPLTGGTSPPNLPLPPLPPLPPAPAVPEPAAALLWSVGLAAGVLWNRRRRQH